MVNLESTPSSGTKKSIEGIQVLTLDSKNRFFIWKDWKEFFPESTEIKLLNAWDYAIIVSKSIFENSPQNPELIVHTTQVDKNNRILLPKNFLAASTIVPEAHIYIIWKWNHLEIYFQKDKFEATKHRAIQAATQLQTHLVLAKV